MKPESHILTIHLRGNGLRVGHLDVVFSGLAVIVRRFAAAVRGAGVCVLCRGIFRFQPGQEIEIVSISVCPDDIGLRNGIRFAIHRKHNIVQVINILSRRDGIPGRGNVSSLMESPPV